MEQFHLCRDKSHGALGECSPKGGHSDNDNVDNIINHDVAAGVSTGCNLWHWVFG
jgi:hypothetical protein